ncbi:hypothetical protein DY000_02029954 [Brassica cretica]|uniref:Pentacotripeptide-repeat region of PRORP domain-containing protein n=1 Tax=Brassica cretica TaxID=69181 RepID=A0ABQ7DV90_BRACR|nr:hypothetical protein DY000_02029954 [Brassica cretica]
MIAMESHICFDPDTTPGPLSFELQEHCEQSDFLNSQPDMFVKINSLDVIRFGLEKPDLLSYETDKTWHFMRSILDNCVVLSQDDIVVYNTFFEKHLESLIVDSRSELKLEIEVQLLRNESIDRAQQPEIWRSFVVQTGYLGDANDRVQSKTDISTFRSFTEEGVMNFPNRRFSSPSIREYKTSKEDSGPRKKRPEPKPTLHEPKVFPQSTSCPNQKHCKDHGLIVPAHHENGSSPAAEDALHSLTAFSGDDDETTFQSLISSFEPTLRGSDVYSFLLHELGNRGECDKALLLYEFAVQRERRKNEQGKQASAMIGTLGRLGKVSIAKTVFESALSGGYGNTVYTFSALISAYGRSGLHNEAITVFDSMKSYGLRPNLVTYNAVIDACGKGGMSFNKVAEFFDEMERNGVQPDRITYNSLLDVCSRGGLWEVARSLFDEMANRKIEQDVFSYNTLLDAICKGGHMDLSFDILSQMRANRIMPNVVSYSTVIDGFETAGRFDEALSLFDEMRYLGIARPGRSGLGIALDRVSYNALLSIYTKAGRDEEALDVLRGGSHSLYG